MKTELQVLNLTDFAEIQSFADTMAIRRIPDEIERRLYSWKAPWREESLNHYLPLGWSFVARQTRTCVGFYLAQPLLFFQGQT